MIVENHNCMYHKTYMTALASRSRLFSPSYFSLPLIMSDVYHSCQSQPIMVATFDGRTTSHSMGADAKRDPLVRTSSNWRYLVEAPC